MAGQKARDAALAIHALTEALAQPCNKDAFDVALVVFDTSAEVREPLQPATQLQGRFASLDLLERHGGSTNVTVGLTKAEEIVEQALKRPVEQLRPVVLLFSDGEHNTGPKPFKVAKRLKGKADIVTVNYGLRGQEVLKRIATSPQHFYACADGSSLRAFMAAVGDTLTTTMARKTDATDALAEIGKQ
jgi:uncharacterized protein YegL